MIEATETVERCRIGVEVDGPRHYRGRVTLGEKVVWRGPKVRDERAALIAAEDRARSLELLRNKR